MLHMHDLLFCATYFHLISVTHGNPVFPDIQYSADLLMAAKCMYAKSFIRAPGFWGNIITGNTWQEKTEVKSRRALLVISFQPFSFSKVFFVIFR